MKAEVKAPVINWLIYRKETKAFEHQDMIPVIGSVRRCLEHFFQEGPESILKFPTVVRCTTAGAPPTPGCYEVLDGTIYRLAFLLGYAEAKEAGEDLERWRNAFATFPVKFELITDESQLLKKKLQYDQDKKAAPEFAGLSPHRLAQAILNVQNMLKDKLLPSVADHVYLYLKSTKWSSEDQISKTSVGTSLKLSERCKKLLECFENHFSKDHVFATLSAIDVLCQKTSCKDDGQAARPGWICVP